RRRGASRPSESCRPGSTATAPGGRPPRSRAAAAATHRGLPTAATMPWRTPPSPPVTARRPWVRPCCRTCASPTGIRHLRPSRATGPARPAARPAPDATKPSLRLPRERRNAERAPEVHPREPDGADALPALGLQRLGRSPTDDDALVLPLHARVHDVVEHRPA